MENYKLASRKQLRYKTSKGLLTTEQLWGLNIDDLDTLAVSLESEYNQSGKKSFVAKTTQKDKDTKLQFDIVLDVLNTKLEEQQAESEAREIKEHNKKIIALIAEKQDESLKNMSEEDLVKLLK